MRQRFFRLLMGVGRLVAVGLLYACICWLVGRPLIPCPFYMVTGLYCPGCGVSRMCLSLLRLDIPAAFAANRLVFLLLPVGAVLALQIAVRYVRTGEHLPTRAQQCVLVCMCIALVTFGVLRNFVPYLQPCG